MFFSSHSTAALMIAVCVVENEKQQRKVADLKYCSFASE
jgi:hypothetical protein